MEKYISALKNVDYAHVARAACEIEWVLNNGFTVAIAGNGGSMAIGQHFACDLLKGESELAGDTRKVVCLGSNPAVLTALSNDVAYSDALSSECVLVGLQYPDMLVTFSVSGTSENIHQVHKYAYGHSMLVIRFVGAETKALPVTPNEICFPIDTKADNYYGVVESTFSAIAHEIAFRVNAIRERRANERRANERKRNQENSWNVGW